MPPATAPYDFIPLRDTLRTMQRDMEDCGLDDAPDTRRLHRLICAAIYETQDIVRLSAFSAARAAGNSVSQAADAA